jgi:uncharacterized protein (TIGR02231 family)
MLKNKAIGGNNNGVSIAELKQAADLFRARIMEINKAIAKIERSHSENSKQVTRINNELYQLNAKTTYSRGEITLLLDAETATTTEIDLKYLVSNVSNAGWTPSYDIRAEDINKPINLEYKAFVYNNTDIDWENIKFKLSTADPSLSATQPKMSPWYLNYKRTYSSYGKKRKTSNLYQQRSVSNTNNELSIQQDKAGLALNAYFNGQSNVVKEISASDFENIAVAELSAEFEIEKPYSVPSDNKPYIVDVAEYELMLPNTNYQQCISILQCQSSKKMHSC